MKIMLMTDMEGVAGVLNHDDWVQPSGRFYEQGIRLLCGEANAAVEGFFAGGATEVVVVDGHGAGGLNSEWLDERAWLQRGCTNPIWPWGLDSSFAGFGVVGQHAKAGTPYSHITHTGSFNVRDLKLNDLSIGEYGQLALCAMELGVPAVLACGEKAFADEAEALTPGVVTAWGKRGLLPDGLEQMEAEKYAYAKLSAAHRSPAAARRLIRDAAESAVRKLMLSPGSFSYPKLSPPYTLRTWFRKSAELPARETLEEHPSSIISLMNRCR